MFFFNFDLKKLAIIALLIILPLFSISLLKPGDQLWIFRPLSTVVGFSQSLFIGFSDSIQKTTSTYINLIGINKSLQRLASENQKLKAKMLNYSELVKENQRLTRILEFETELQYSVEPAQVIGTDVFAERSSIRINKGKKDGVEKGDAVITQEAVVGYILESHASTSVVLVLTDRYAVIDAILHESRARGIVEGSGIDSCILKYLQRSDEVNVGDLVVTSGLDQVFPKGIPIAKVKNVERKKSEITPSIELTPIVDATRLDEVFVVTHIDNEPFAVDAESLDEGENPNSKNEGLSLSEELENTKEKPEVEADRKTEDDAGVETE